MAELRHRSAGIGNVVELRVFIERDGAITVEGDPAGVIGFLANQQWCDGEVSVTARRIRRDG